MQQCPNCKHQNRAGIVFCENCGASLIGKLPVDTKSLEASSEEEKEQIGIDSSILTDVKVQGRAAFEEDASLQLEVEGSPEAILFKPKPETIFGRRDPATGAMPDIDLTPYAGYRMGVSRRHAAIRHGEEQSLDLWDLGSSNGTFLNGQRLSAHRPYRLHDGDELRLGQMVIRLYFKSGNEVPEPPAPKPELETTEAAPVGMEPPEPAQAEQPAASGPITSPVEVEQPSVSRPITSPVEPKPQPTTTNLADILPIEEKPTTEKPTTKPTTNDLSDSPAKDSLPPEAPKESGASTEKPDSPPSSENGKQRDSA